MKQIKAIQLALKWTGIIILILAALVVVLAIAKYPLAAVALGTTVVILILVATHLGFFTLGCLYARGILLMGADVGLRAQQGADEREVGLVNSVSRLAEAIIRATKETAQPALPMPTQGQPDRWLPTSLKTPMLEE